MKIEKITYNIYYLTNISFSIYEDNKKIYETDYPILPEIFVNDLNLEKQTIVENHKDPKVLRIQDNFGFTFLCYYISNKNVLFGPFLINDDFESYIDQIILSYRFINEEAQMVENYYNNLKILSEPQQSMLTNILLNYEDINLDTIKIYNV